MDISVPSRFACLKIEDDDFRPSGNKSRQKPDNKPQIKQPSAKEASKKPSAPNQKAQSSSKKNKSKTKSESTKQWEDWKRKDDELVDDNFEEQLQSAILQSKLEFEKQKKNPPIKNDGDQSKKNKKGKTMSLDQFLENGGENDTKEVVKIKEDEANFFENVIETAKQEITKEKVEEGRKKRQKNFEEVISLAQCQEKLELERAKNVAFEKEIEEARKEIALVKKRNTTLCSMLSQGEMKDKAEVLLELERLTLVKEELTDEVARLYKLLEQERSNKANNSPGESHSKHSKDKIKKKKN